MDELVNWMPAQCSLVDFMHCVMLGRVSFWGCSKFCDWSISSGMIKHLNRVIIYKSGMLNSRTRGDENLKKMEAFFSTIIWPPSISRLPPSVSTHRCSILQGKNWWFRRCRMARAQWRLTNGVHKYLFCSWHSSSHGKLMVWYQTLTLLPQLPIPKLQLPRQHLRNSYVLVCSRTSWPRIPTPQKKISIASNQQKWIDLSVATMTWSLSFLPQYASYLLRRSVQMKSSVDVLHFLALFNLGHAWGVILHRIFTLLCTWNLNFSSLVRLMAGGLFLTNAIMVFSDDSTIMDILVGNSRVQWCADGGKPSLYKISYVKWFPLVLLFPLTCFTSDYTFRRYCGAFSRRWRLSCTS